MASQMRSIAYVAAGVLGSATLFMVGMVFLTTQRGGPLLFWIAEIGLQALLWRLILLSLGRDIGGQVKERTSPGARIMALALSGVVFLALWVFAVFFTGGRVGLPLIAAYAAASGVSLFLVSLPNRLTAAAYRVRMSALVAGTLAMISVGLFYLGGGTLQGPAAGRRMGRRDDRSSPWIGETSHTGSLRSPAPSSPLRPSSTSSWVSVTSPSTAGCSL